MDTASGEEINEWPFFPWFMTEFSFFYFVTGYWKNMTVLETKMKLK